MYLKAIEIHGFKSFANKTTVTFMPSRDGRQSVTAIVGPNGSGKSNISDAIRWVMGEQRMKQLRGKKSEDIIFSGSESKGKMGMASVSMILDNTDKRADLDYDELIISRRLYRSGDSEYLINGQPVRLLDLHLLLAKAQFGHGSYSVVGQGMIDRLVLQSSAQRKAFFDEAAGIKEFQIKRHQSTLKLARTREHISQASLLLKEVTPRLKSLSRQVQKLEQRQDLEVALREFQEVYYSTLWQHHAGESSRIRAILDEVEHTYATTHKELTTIQEELASLAQQASRQEVFAGLQQEYQRILQQKNNLERERAVLQGRMHTEYSKVGKQNVGWLENKIRELSQKRDEHTQIVSREQAAFTTLQEQTQQFAKEQEQLGFRRTQLRGQLANLQQQLLQAKSEQSISQFTGIRAVQAVLEHRHQFEGVHGAIAQLGKVEASYQLAMDVAAGGHISSIVVKHDSTAQACIDFLRQHQHGFATFLPLNKIRPRFVPTDVERFIGMPGVHGFAVDLIDFDAKFRDVFSYIFGATLIVEDIDIARKVGIGRVRMVTLAGDVLEMSGSMKGGYRKRGGHKRLSFSQRDGYAHNTSVERIEEAIVLSQQELEEAEVQFEKIREQGQAQASTLRITEHRLQSAQAALQTLAEELAGFEQEKSFHTMSPDEYNVAMKDVADQTVMLDTQLAASAEELAVVEKKIASFNDEEEKKKQRVFALQESMQTTQAQLNTYVDQKNTQQVALAKLETKQEDLLNELYQEMRLSIEQIMSRYTEVVDLSEIEQLQTKIQKTKYKLSLIGGIDDDVVAEYEETKARHDGLSLQLSDLEKAMRDLEKLIAELDTLMKKRHSKAFLQIKKEFQRYFSLLFDGGKANLIEVFGYEGEGKEVENAEESEEVFVDTEDGSDTKKKRRKKMLQGIDIVACPPGKKITHLQALSGGERTMTSIALICAILKVNPSPFVVLDEVEAALDEANTVRLTNILRELSSQSQFILITHNRATMHAADALYGVTMGNDGISHLLSVKLGEAEKAIAE